MQAVVLRKFGDPEVLRYEEVPTPIPGPGKVLVRVHAVSVNRTLDLKVRQDGGGYGVGLPLVRFDCSSIGPCRCARPRLPTDSWSRTTRVARSSWIQPLGEPSDPAHLSR